MSFQYTSGDPNDLVGGLDASLADIQGPFTDLKAFLNERISAIPTLVSSLPVSPVDGQEVYYLADAANGVVWHLRYRAASGSTYKWEFVGGGPLTAEVAAAQSTASTTFVDLTTVGPSITVPLAGDYVFSMAANISQAGTGNVGIMGLKIGAAAVVDSVQSTPGFAGAGQTASHPILRRTVAAAATVVKLQYAANTNTATFSTRFLGVRPVRVA